MRNKIIRSTSILLCLAMLCSVSAYAAEMRASERIKSYSATLNWKSNGDLNLALYMSTNGVMNTLGVSSVVIQRYTGSSWVDEYTFTVKNTPSIQISNADLYLNTLTYTPNDTKSNYHAEVTFYAEDSSGSNTKPVTTNTV